MGKRKKSGRKPVSKGRKETLATTFQCLFCNHEKSVTVKMDKKQNIGQLSCKVCGQSFQSPIHALSAPVDIYFDWVDACENVAAKPDSAADRPIQNTYRGTAMDRGGAADADADADGEDEMAEFIEQDELSVRHAADEIFDDE